jgi:UDP:flavonoid glycosyltransferase YjiC (YdhE family)
MRICIIAWGGNGDVLPMLAFAKGLRKAGHAVSVAAPARYQAAVEELESVFFPTGPDPDRMPEVCPPWKGRI